MVESHCVETHEISIAINKQEKQYGHFNLIPPIL